MRAYFEMVRRHALGVPFNKRAAYRQLAAQFPHRTAKAFEWKLQNVSAALSQLGRPWLPGLVPASNMQKSLLDIVGEMLQAERDVDAEFSRVVDAPAEDLAAALPTVEDLARALQKWESLAPSPKVVVASQVAERISAPIRGIDYPAREARNRSLGRIGEEFAVRYERARLLVAERKDLAQRVEHVAETQGDGLGYDIASYEADGSRRLVEVKTTAYAAETPFFVSQREREVSASEAPSYRLLRLYDFRTLKRKAFTLAGHLDQACDLEPTTYRARVRGSG